MACKTPWVSTEHSQAGSVPRGGSVWSGRSRGPMFAVPTVSLAGVLVLMPVQNA